MMDEKCSDRLSGMTDSCVRLRLQYLYPTFDRSFFSSRELELYDDQIVRTGLFGKAPDIAGIAVAFDSMHVQFNETDFFCVAEANGLLIELPSSLVAKGNQLRIEEYGGFSEVPRLIDFGEGHQIVFTGKKVGPDHYLRLAWANR